MGVDRGLAGASGRCPEDDQRLPWTPGDLQLFVGEKQLPCLPVLDDAGAVTGLRANVVP